MARKDGLAGMKWPITMLWLLGREWEADAYVASVMSGRVSSNFTLEGARSAVKRALSYDW